jgi:hypothetical protein
MVRRKVLNWLSAVRGDFRCAVNFQAAVRAALQSRMRVV